MTRHYSADDTERDEALAPSSCHRPLPEALCLVKHLDITLKASEPEKG